MEYFPNHEILSQPLSAGRLIIDICRYQLYRHLGSPSQCFTCILCKYTVQITTLSCKDLISSQAFVSIPAWFRYTGNLSSYIGCCSPGQWVRACACLPIPISEKTNSSCFKQSSSILSVHTCNQPDPKTRPTTTRTRLGKGRNQQFTPEF